MAFVLANDHITCDQFEIVYSCVHENLSLRKDTMSYSAVINCTK